MVLMCMREMITVLGQPSKEEKTRFQAYSKGSICQQGGILSGLKGKQTPAPKGFVLVAVVEAIYDLDDSPGTIIRVEDPLDTLQRVAKVVIKKK